MTSLKGNMFGGNFIAGYTCLTIHQKFSFIGREMSIKLLDMIQPPRTQKIVYIPTEHKVGETL
jgi:DNA-binding LacI/PurR family transcriptional regulator